MRHFFAVKMQDKSLDALVASANGILVELAHIRANALLVQRQAHSPKAPRSRA